MRAWVIRATGGLDRLELTDVPPPAPPAATPGPRDVRVGIRAAALNHLDLFVVQGLPLEYRFPHILGADGAGVVEAVGQDVATVRPGDRVMLNPGSPITAASIAARESIRCAATTACWASTFPAPSPRRWWFPSRTS